MEYTKTNRRLLLFRFHVRHSHPHRMQYYHPHPPQTDTEIFRIHTRAIYSFTYDFLSLGF